MYMDFLNYFYGNWNLPLETTKKVVENQNYFKCCLIGKETHSERIKGNISGLILENHNWQLSPCHW